MAKMHREERVRLEGGHIRQVRLRLCGFCDHCVVVGMVQIGGGLSVLNRRVLCVFGFDSGELIGCCQKLHIFARTFRASSMFVWLTLKRLRLLHLRRSAHRPRRLPHATLHGLHVLAHAARLTGSLAGAQQGAHGAHDQHENDGLHVEVGGRLALIYVRGKHWAYPCNVRLQWRLLRI